MDISENISYLYKKQEQLVDMNLNNIFTSPSTIKKNFYKIWNDIIQKIDLNISANESFAEIKDLVIYDILDGTRSTLISKYPIDNRLEAGLYALNFIHTLKSLNAKNCYIMIHTAYNRERGKKEFNQILEKILAGKPFVIKYAIQNNICCLCICSNNNFEYIDLLKDVYESTKKGIFNSIFLFDYNENWPFTKEGKNIFKNLPNIDVFIRHTKFQISGGWIPYKMTHSVFLYTQNGSTFSNWDSDELVALIALALLAKLLHRGEVLNKTYTTKEEINYRYILREKELFNKIITLRKNPKKLFILGSPNGIYQFYY